MGKKKLTRSSDKKLYGVCAGIAEYMDWDVSVLRLLCIVLTICTGIMPGIVIYLLFALIMPVENGV